MVWTVGLLESLPYDIWPPNTPIWLLDGVSRVLQSCTVLKELLFTCLTYGLDRSRLSIVGLGSAPLSTNLICNDLNKLRARTCLTYSRTVLARRIDNSLSSCFINVASVLTGS